MAVGHSLNLVREHLFGRLEVEDGEVGLLCFIKTVFHSDSVEVHRLLEGVDVVEVATIVVDGDVDSEAEILPFDFVVGGNEHHEKSDLVSQDRFIGHELDRLEDGDLAVKDVHTGGASILADVFHGVFLVDEIDV